MRELQREIDELIAQRPTTELEGNERRPQSAAGAAQARPEALKARELVPEISSLGRRCGLQIRTIKQSAEGVGQGERQIRLMAQGEFPAVVTFIEAISSSLPQGRVEELNVRHLSDAEALEVESVLRVRVEEPAAVDPGRP
jgi:hypothetical protein